VEPSCVLICRTRVSRWRQEDSRIRQNRFGLGQSQARLYATITWHTGSSASPDTPVHRHHPAYRFIG
jgi:hypothetical protein